MAKVPMKEQRKCRRKLYGYMARHRAAGNFRIAGMIRKAIHNRSDLLTFGGYYDGIDGGAE